MSDPAQPGAKPISLPKTCAWAGALVFFDAFFLNQGVISACIGLWMLLGALPRAAFHKDHAQRRRRLARVAIYLGAVALVLGLNWANNRLAQSRAEALIGAIKAYQQKHQRFPAKLDELVPEFVEQVPVAKYTLAFGGFYYVATPDYHGLFYVEMPPFGRPTYHFEQNAWGYVD